MTQLTLFELERQCRRCGGHNFRQSSCRTCHAAYMRRYFSDPENRAKKVARDRSYKESHREQGRRNTKEWERHNRERISAYKKLYYVRNKEKMISYVRERGRTELGRLQKRLTKLKRRASQDGGHITALQWKSILMSWGERCVYCGLTGIRLEVDHFRPLSRGGMHAIHNVVPACRSCNAKKCDADPFAFLHDLLGSHDGDR